MVRKDHQGVGRIGRSAARVGLIMNTGQLHSATALIAVAVLTFLLCACHSSDAE